MEVAVQVGFECERTGGIGKIKIFIFERKGFVDRYTNFSELQAKTMRSDWTVTWMGTKKKASCFVESMKATGVPGAMPSASLVGL